jgi:hypothetical protein
MSPQSECVDTAKEMVKEVMLEKEELVEHLNAMHQRIEEEKDLVVKALLKVECTDEKHRSIDALSKVVASLQRVLEEEDMIGGKRGDPARQHSDRAAPAPLCEPATCPPREQPARLDILSRTTTADLAHDPDGPLQNRPSSGSLLDRETTSSPSSNTATALARSLTEPTRSWRGASTELARSLSESSKQLPKQVRRTLAKRARRVSSSVLRTIGWSPAFPERFGTRSWDYSV